VDHNPTPDNPGWITFKIVNNSSNRYLCNGVFRAITDDGTKYMAHFREPSLFDNGAHYYYWDETNFVLEPGETITSDVPIARTYGNETQIIDLNKKLKVDDGVDGYVLYHSVYSSTEGDYLLHSKPQSIIKSSSLRVYPTIEDYNNGTNEITDSTKNNIVIGRVYEIRATEQSNYILPDGVDKNAKRAYANHVTSSGETVLDPIRLEDWKDYDPDDPTPVNNYPATIYTINDAGEDIYSTGEIRLYVGQHTGINSYLPGASGTAGKLYTFKTGESMFTCNGMTVDDKPPVKYKGQTITEVRFYDYRHYQNEDAGFSAELYTEDPRCDTTIKENGAVYVIKIGRL
jgi:hypothetical protein